MGDLSPHFSRSEFRCRCPRRHRVTLVDYELVQVLERIRHRSGRALPVLSGYRCKAHDREVTSATNGQHPLGRAADIPEGRCTVAQALEAGARGVGHVNGWAVHVDVREGPVVTFADRPYRR